MVSRSVGGQTLFLLGGEQQTPPAPNSVPTFAQKPSSSSSTHDVVAVQEWRGGGGTNDLRPFRNCLQGKDSPNQEYKIKVFWTKMATISNAKKIANREKSVENAAMRLERIGVERRVSQLLLFFLPSATSAISRRPFNWTTALDSLPAPLSAKWLATSTPFPSGLVRTKRVAI